MSARKVLTWYAGGIGVLVVGFFALPAFRTVLTGAVGLVSVTAVAVGVRRYRPNRAYSWWLLGAALAVFTVGDTVYLLAANLPLGESKSTSAVVSDVFYLVMLPLIGAGLLGLTRSTTGARDRSGLLDFLIFTTVGAFLLWVLVIHPYLIGVGSTTFEQSALAAYALLDVLLLATTVRLAITSQRSVAAMLLVTGAIGNLVADLVYGAALLAGGWQPGGPTELGWLLFYASWGAAALHPSMARLTEPAAPQDSEIDKTRLVLLGLAATLAPAVLLLQVINGDVRDGAVIAVVGGVVFALVLSRLGDAVDGHRQAVARERGLRQAGAELVAAADTAEVRRAVRTAVARLVPRQFAHRIVFSINHTHGVPAATMSIWGPGVAAPSAFYPAPTSAAARRSRLLRVRTLQPALAEQLQGFETVALCPLVGDGRASGAPRVGALLVAADSRLLPTLRDSLEVLAAQAAMALERISLAQEINRRDSETYFRSLVQNAADVILIVDDDHQIRYASPSVLGVLGVEPVDCTDLAAVLHADDQLSVSTLLDPVRPEPDRRADGVDLSVRRSDGQRVQLEVTCRDLRRDRAVRGFVLTMRDVTERVRLEQELTHRAVHDTLTGLANRASYQDQVYEAVEKARDGDRTVGALSIDLDEFTAVNDTHGHAIGDALLVAAGQRLREIVSPNDLVARLGGDEFAVLVRDADGPEQVEQVADRLVQALAEPLEFGDTVVNGSVSVGVATTDDASDAGELLQRADLALYVAKGAGKGRWCRYQSELHTAIVERLELRAALTEAVEKLSFSVEYQPIVDMRTGVAVGFEALARWHHPARGPVPPEQFIGLAEETGLIEPIGDWVLRQAVGAAARWHADRGERGTPYVSINVSARQLRTPGFVATVRAALAAADVPPDRVMLEITESLLLRDEEPVWSELSELRAHGLRVAIDDFGTGFSSLSYLQQMPADVLKIDRSFTETVASSRRQRLLVEGIIRLAGTLGLDIIAEGVETEAVRTILLDMGCSSGQGYLFSRPLRDPDALRWLRGDPPPPGLPPKPRPPGD
ncbi:putative bifunctional diguanylate cyclase/phosphodiesterase [Plantactinospora soyae]|uniref:Diguanylate cyclase (GGDEF)-like protein/PAS domain S-box-containing protein n=1 Tax=Plantactinospora soyae TaxID=1544732 RepID=A0A927M2R4_9ACTN|nr:EAL domain-containing protein [Plantactinospora soyae]MBE1487098.1 diguanylate cyclase (GGDEF)-like protein/PAS domain S-box-containing protein [Plantactinospora soyae]